MYDLEEKTKRLSEMKERLEECLESEMAKGVGCVDTDEAGKVVDMIKDLAQAEKDCAKACYYKTVIEAMTEGAEEPRWGDSRSGYNNRRYSNGEYAPAGRGHVSGYDPMMPHYLDPTLNEIQYWDPDRPGYSRSQSGTRVTGRNSTISIPSAAQGGRYGYSYSEFEDSKHRYDETKSPADKEAMEEHAKEHVKDSMHSIRKIWDVADPALKKKLKGDLTAMINDLTV